MGRASSRNAPTATVGRRQPGDKGPYQAHLLREAQSGDLASAMRFLSEYAAEHDTSLASAPADVCAAVVERLARDAGEHFLPATDCAMAVSGLVKLTDDEGPHAEADTVDEVVRGKVGGELSMFLPTLVDFTVAEASARSRDVYARALSDYLGTLLTDRGDAAVMEVAPLPYRQATERLQAAEVRTALGPLVGRRRWGSLIRDTLDSFQRHPDNLMRVDAEYYTRLVATVTEAVDNAIKPKPVPYRPRYSRTSG